MSRYLRWVLGLTAMISAFSWAQSAPDAPLLSRAKQNQLAQWETLRAQAVAHANLNASPEALDELAHVFDGHPRVWLGEDFHGGWMCRLVRLSPRTPVEVQEWRSCTITEMAGAWLIDAPMGQGRIRGQLLPHNDRQLWFVSERGSQVGIAVSHRENRLRIEFPAPRAAVTYEVLELRRR